MTETCAWKLLSFGKYDQLWTDTEWSLKAVYTVKHEDLVQKCQISINILQIIIWPWKFYVIV